MQDYGNIKIRFGKYKGKKLSEIPEDYLDFLLNKNILRGKYLLYAKIIH